MLLNNFLLVVPCHNEGKNISLFVNEIKKLKIKFKVSYDICFIDDGSIDNTWEQIKLQKEINDNVRGIRLSRNFGKEAAVSAGLSYNKKEYDFYVIIDCDFQHPMDKIPDLVNTIKNGDYEIVSTYRSFGSQGKFRELFSKLFYKIFNMFSKIKMLSKTTDFMAITKKIRDNYNSINESQKTFRVMINWIGFKKISLPIEVKNRKYGKSKFKFLNLLRLAVNTFSSYTLFPLKAVGYLGIFMMIISSILLLFVFYNFFYQITVISWQTILLLSQLFFSGTIMSSIGIVGLYISKIFDNVNQRPNFIIDKII